MSDVGETPITVGLYRHDVPEEDTLRALLEWLRDAGVAVLSLTRALSSIQESKMRLFMAEMELKFEKLRSHAAKALPPLSELHGLGWSRLDDATIDSVVRSNNEFPQRIRVTLPISLDAPMWLGVMEVGYDARRPDDVRADGRRLISARVLRSRLGSSPEATSWLPDRLLSPLEWSVAFVYQCAPAVTYTYASIHSEREPPTPTVLRSSDDPRDFDHLCLPMPKCDIEAAEAELGAGDDWSGHPFQDGILFVLRAQRLTDAGREYMERLRSLVVSRIG